MERGAEPKVHVIQQTGLHPEAVAATWGLPPATSKHSFLINARMETVAEKPTFRDAFIHHRCLVPATGWYEWSAPKQPWHIQLRDGGPMAMAGLLFRRGGKMNFIIVTSAADGDLAQIHHRQPLVLQRASWQSWLCGGAADAQNCLQATPAQSFNWYRVGASVGRVAEDHPGLVTRLMRGHWRMRYPYPPPTKFRVIFLADEIQSLYIGHRHFAHDNPV